MPAYLPSALLLSFCWIASLAILLLFLESWFGVPSPKTGITGKNVSEYFKAGKLDEIAKYCLGDCKATGQLFQKLKNYYR